MKKNKKIDTPKYSLGEMVYFIDEIDLSPTFGNILEIKMSHVVGEYIYKLENYHRCGYQSDLKEYEITKNPDDLQEILVNEINSRIDEIQDLGIERINYLSSIKEELVDEFDNI